LVILDNVASTKAIEPLLACLPCLVIVISRRRLAGLGQGGVQYVSVPPLSYEVCRTWLAGHIGPRADHGSDAVIALASMCGGNALVLRLMANHIVNRDRVPIADFVDEFRDTGAILRLGEDRDNPGGSVLDVFTTWYQALEPDERRMFRLLG